MGFRFKEFKTAVTQQRIGPWKIILPLGKGGQVRCQLSNFPDEAVTKSWKPWKELKESSYDEVGDFLPTRGL